MARKSEVGIEYFPMNSDIVHNPKLKLVVAEFGPKAWGVLLPLYCKIYREKGYWMDWHDEDSKLLFALDECKMEETVVNEIVKGCIRRSLFDKRVFDKFGILTSDRIQENYIIAKKRGRNIKLIRDFLLIPESVYKTHESVTVIPINATLITKKITIIPQKEIIEGEKEGDRDCASAHTPAQILLFKKYQEWVSKNAPRVNQLKEPLTIDQFLKLREDFPQPVIMEVLTAMQNKADLLKKYVSANLTIRNWSKNQHTVKTEETAKSNLSAAIKAIESGN